MNQTYTAFIQQRGDWWIGWIEEIPSVNCQEKTREELLAENHAFGSLRLQSIAGTCSHFGLLIRQVVIIR